jgi:hypothetical protein
MLIVKAGLAICETKEKGIALIEKGIMEEFTAAVEGFILPSSFNGFDRDAFYRTKNFGTVVDKVESGDLHTGASLWRKFKEIRLILLNEFSPLLAKKMPGGLLPSGKTYSEVLTACRRAIFEASEDLAEKRSKSSKGFKRTLFHDSWYPVEWEAFVTYGNGSPNPSEFLNAK